MLLKSIPWAGVSNSKGRRPAPNVHCPIQAPNSVANLYTALRGRQGVVCQKPPDTRKHRGVKATSTFTTKGELGLWLWYLQQQQQQGCGSPSGRAELFWFLTGPEPLLLHLFLANATCVAMIVSMAAFSLDMAAMATGSWEAGEEPCVLHRRLSRISCATVIHIKLLAGGMGDRISTTM